MRRLLLISHRRGGIITSIVCQSKRVLLFPSDIKVAPLSDQAIETKFSTNAFYEMKNNGGHFNQIKEVYFKKKRSA